MEKAFSPSAILALTKPRHFYKISFPSDLSGLVSEGGFVYKPNIARIINASTNGWMYTGQWSEYSRARTADLFGLLSSYIVEYCEYILCE